MDLGGLLGHQTLGTIRTLLERDHITQAVLPAALPQDGRWMVGELPASLETLTGLRNPAAHLAVRP